MRLQIATPGTPSVPRNSSHTDPDKEPRSSSVMGLLNNLFFVFVLAGVAIAGIITLASR